MSGPRASPRSGATASRTWWKAGAAGAAGGADVVASISIDRASDDDIWVVNGKPGMPTALLAWSGHDQHWPGHPHTLADAHLAASNAEARLKLMDEVGVHANLLFPNVGAAASTSTSRVTNRNWRWSAAGPTTIS